MGPTTLQSISFGKNSSISKNCIATKNFCPKGKINNQIFPYKISILGFLHHLKNLIEGPIIWFISPIRRRKIQSKAPVFFLNGRDLVHWKLLLIAKSIPMFLSGKRLIGPIVRVTSESCFTRMAKKKSICYKNLQLW